MIYLYKYIYIYMYIRLCCWILRALPRWVDVHKAVIFQELVQTVLLKLASVQVECQPWLPHFCQGHWCWNSRCFCLGWHQHDPKNTTTAWLMCTEVTKYQALALAGNPQNETVLRSRKDDTSMFWGVTNVKIAKAMWGKYWHPMTISEQLYLWSS